MTPAEFDRLLASIHSILWTLEILALAGGIYYLTRMPDRDGTDRG